MRRVGSLLLVGLAFGGCGTRALPATTSEVPDCDTRVVEGNLCPGAPPVVCAGTCAVEPDCAATLEVPSPAEVDRLRAAPRGACARLGDGDYPALSIENVSLYGAGEARVRLRGLEVNSTERVRIRGVLVGAQGVSVRGTGEVLLQGVRVLGATGTSVHATPTVRLALDRVTIENGGGFGLMRECSTGAALVEVTLAHVRVVNTRGAGSSCVTRRRRCGGSSSTERSRRTSSTVAPSISRAARSRRRPRSSPAAPRPGSWRAVGSPRWARASTSTVTSPGWSWARRARRR
ncbi:MAG: right-handed parallel beta-helix repeat-containing protein [Myxococcales bacterium]|nr:right-handed parallel beta-helix repeat-containing protein [Myxococcales bacterium]